MRSRPTKEKTPAASTAEVLDAKTPNNEFERTKPVNSRTKSRTALVFHETTFQVVDQEGDPWLRGAQIALALGYKNAENAIKDLYSRNADEFSEHMTQVVELRTAGGMQKVRIFSLRGAHMLGMLAKTETAKAFRQWVLDILEGTVAPQETGRMTYPQRLAYLKERRSLVRELGTCSEEGSAKELYSNFGQVSRLLGLSLGGLEALAPALRQKRLALEGGAA